MLHFFRLFKNLQDIIDVFPEFAPVHFNRYRNCGMHNFTFLIPINRGWVHIAISPSYSKVVFCGKAIFDK
jgi:hypothetical protein